jgi:hypothetical protein
MVLSGMSIDSVDRILWRSNLRIEKNIYCNVQDYVLTDVRMKQGIEFDIKMDMT